MQVACAHETAPTTAKRALTTAELTCFRSLVAASILPVDDAFVEANLSAFTALVCEGIPANLILEAWSDYVAHKRQQLRSDPTTHVMHLLTWLRLRPNNNIAYLLRKEGRNTGASTHVTPAAVSTASPIKLSRCHDRHGCVWFVHEGARSWRLEGSENVESADEARALLELRLRQRKEVRAS